MAPWWSCHSKSIVIITSCFVRKKSHRAVAPIIATLLLITIAVIGGVMIYVFTQGFFGNASISRVPSVDTIVLSGYDMREILEHHPCDNSHSPATRGTITHEGEVTCHGDYNTGDGKFDEEAGTIFIRNVGEKPYNLLELEVNGKKLDFKSTDPEISNRARVFGIYTVPDTQTATAGTTLREVATILPGQEGTLVVTFDGSGTSADNSAAAGRIIPIKLTSSSGSVYNFNIVIGEKK